MNVRAASPPRPSTAGVLAAIIACVRRHQQQQLRPQAQAPGAPIRRPSKVILPRNAHKSAINALVLSGADPIFLTPLYDAEWDLCYGTPIRGPGGLEAALAEHAPGGEVAAVLLVSPTYNGALTDVKAAADYCRRYNVPLIVDEAHGAHLPFLGLPGALQAGADLVVQSSHKTLTALSQAAMLHAGGGRERERCNRKRGSVRPTSTC